MDSYCISSKRGKGLRSSHWLLPSALYSQLLLPMWLGTCTMEKVRGGDIGLLSEPNSSSSLPPKGPGNGRVPDVVCLQCRCFVHTLSGLVEHLRPPDSKEQKRGLPPAQDCVCQSHRPNMPWFMEPLLEGLSPLSQCGGFMAPCPRCCFCFCCINSCSRAEGPGCIMELDQMD